MERVGFWRHFGNNNVVFLRRIYESTACDSVCQNRCRMQGIWVVKDCSNTGYAGYSVPLHSIPLSRWNSTRNEKKTKEVGWSVRSENRGAVGDYFDLGFAATVKTYSFSWPVYSSLSLVESLKFSLCCMRDQFGISWKPSDYSNSKCKRSILRVHHMKLHGKLNASVFFTWTRHIFKRIVKKSASCNEVIKIVGLRINWCRELL